uniref:Uncharacterized protein n=1 Tax=Trichogramma kaykai TaxID=54128 RepID=A0ABD2XEK3_9HYME
MYIYKYYKRRNKSRELLTHTPAKTHPCGSQNLDANPEQRHVSHKQRAASNVAAKEPNELTSKQTTATPQSTTTNREQ